MINKADIVIKNYERDIEYYGDEMKQHCPCYLSTIYKSASYFAKLSSQYNKAFKYVLNSITLCPTYKEAYIMLIVLLLPKKVILFLSKIRVYFKSKAK
jgi:polyhydroxyalkanoate synthesis regulator protein